MPKNPSKPDKMPIDFEEVQPDWSEDHTVKSNIELCNMVADERCKGDVWRGLCLVLFICAVIEGVIIWKR